MVYLRRVSRVFLVKPFASHSVLEPTSNPPNSNKNLSLLLRVCLTTTKCQPQPHCQHRSVCIPSFTTRTTVSARVRIKSNGQNPSFSCLIVFLGATNRAAGARTQIQQQQQQRLLSHHANTLKDVIVVEYCSGLLLDDRKNSFNH